MNMKQAKAQIVTEINILLNMNFVSTVEIEQHLISSVKLGTMTAADAAKASNENYEFKCTMAFNKKEAKEAAEDVG